MKPIYTLILLICVLSSCRAQSEKKSGKQELVQSIYLSFKNQSTNELLNLTPKTGDLETYFKDNYEIEDQDKFKEFLKEITTYINEQKSEVNSGFNDVSFTGSAYGIKWDEIELENSQIELVNSPNQYNMADFTGYITISFNGAQYNLDFNKGVKIGDFYFLPVIYQLDKIKRSPEEISACEDQKKAWREYCLESLSESFPEIDESKLRSTCECTIDTIGDNPNRDCMTDFERGRNYYSECTERLIEERKKH